MCYARSLEKPGDRTLLVDREQQVGLYTDHERLLERCTAEQANEVAVRRQVEAIHGARDIMVAICIESADETLRQGLEVALHGKFGGEGPPALHVITDRLTPEAQLPLGS